MTETKPQQETIVFCIWADLLFDLSVCSLDVVYTNLTFDRVSHSLKTTRHASLWRTAIPCINYITRIVIGREKGAAVVKLLVLSHREMSFQPLSSMWTVIMFLSPSYLLWFHPGVLVFIPGCNTQSDLDTSLIGSSAYISMFQTNLLLICVCVSL